MPRWLSRGLFPLVASAATLLAPLSAAASTLPRVDFRQGDRMLAVGLLDANFDWARLDSPSIGASPTTFPSTPVGRCGRPAARLTTSRVTM